MLTFLSIIHIFIGIGLVIFVLLQDPKGGAAGVFGGGSSSTSFFGASGASNFLTITTKWLAILFAVSCLVLTAITSKKPTSVLDQVDLTAPAAAATAPVVPGTPDAGAPTTPAAPMTPPAAATPPPPAQQ